jgi:hypothetical protein
LVPFFHDNNYKGVASLDEAAIEFTASFLSSSLSACASSSAATTSDLEMIWTLQSLASSLQRYDQQQEGVKLAEKLDHVVRDHASRLSSLPPLALRGIFRMHLDTRVPSSMHEPLGIMADHAITSVLLRMDASVPLDVIIPQEMAKKFLEWVWEIRGFSMRESVRLLVRTHFSPLLFSFLF